MQKLSKFVEGCEAVLVLLVFAAFIVLGLLAMPKDAAAEEEGESVRELWAHVYSTSYHFDREEKHNEDSGGFAMEYRWAENHSVAAGFYKNSNWEISRYATYQYLPARWMGFRAGGFVGLVDGYETTNNGGPGPMGGLMAAYEYKRVGVNLIAIPFAAEKGVVAMTFKLKIF